MIAGKNDYRVGLLNGTRGTVTDVDVERGALTVLTREGRSIEVRRRYLAAGHLTHGYATTVHKAQGATVDVSLLLVDTSVLPGGGLHGPIARGRVANRVYVVSDDNDAIEAHGVSRERTDGVARLCEALARSAAQEMASRSSGRGRAR